MIANNDKELLIELFADQQLRHILSLTSGREYSAIQLSQELGISLATAYRKLKLLEEAGIIKHVKTIINLSGNEEKYFRCAIREATIHFQNGVFSFDLKKEDYGEKIVRLWKRLAHPDGKDAGLPK